jgi:PASTA domain
VKSLGLALIALALAAPGAAAQTNDVTFTQTPGDDGLYRLTIGVSYVFPGLPPRTGNSGVGTVRVTLPGASFAIDFADPGYTCVLESAGTALCSSEGMAQEGGIAFPTSMTLRLVSRSCWPGDQPGSADVWAAPNDPGSAPDVRLPIQGAGCTTDTGVQPVLDTKESCKVPSLKNLTLKAATRELTAGDCARGKVAYAYSAKVRKGRVVSQSARPGRTLKAGAKVNVVISKGRKR